MPSRRHCLHFGERIARHYTRLRFFWRTPLCACGETSFTPRISRPAACSDRIAVSRPEPGPFTNTSTFCRPCSMPLRAAASAVTCAANGVDLREPLKPGRAGRLPDDHVAVLVGERDDRVVERRLDVRLTDRDVLADAAARATARGRCSARRRHYFAFFPRPTVFFGPLRVRAFVFVRWPRAGRLRRCRRPRYAPISDSRLIACVRSRRRSPSTC